MRITKKVFIIIFCILFISLFNVFKVQNFVLKKVYPLQFKEYVEKYASEYDVDRLWIYAIIKGESNFDENANSVSGAKGLMQIMEETAKDMILNVDIGYEQKYNLYDPQTNIMLGSKYFSLLLKEYNNNEKLALAAYNAGKGNVKKWIEKGIIKEDGSDLEKIPFKETNMYVRRIIQNYKIYKELYEK